MKRVLAIGVVLVSVSVAAATTAQQQPPPTPVMDAVAQKVIQKYQSASCADLMEKKAAPTATTGAQDQKRADMIQMLRNNPAMRQAFIDKVAGPIANKMFDCGMIP